MTFIVRLSPGGDHRITGIVERVRTGQKERFHGVEELGRLITRMVEAEAMHPDTGGKS